uniref:G-protein coupled receptors family 1 profile domain-containing protein n=1 Tax=Scleropages formosus TaxID=113540 RepID=A0A8C9TEY9_SCLFO
MQEPGAHMETTTQDLSNFTRPVGFYIRGFYALKNSEYYFIFLAVIYVFTLAANLTLMVIIWFSEVLHTPKYMAVFSLAVVDVSLSSALIPKAVNMYLFDSKFIYFNACLAQMFFVDFFASMEAFCLCVLAYDRLIAICFPLRSHTINTNRKMMLVIMVSCWVLAFAILVAALVLITHLSFCKPVPTVMSYFCDHGPIFQIACSDNSPNWKITVFFLFAVIYVPLGFILMSYVFIILAVSRITSLDGRWKTFKTCSVHLILVAIFFTPFLVTYTITWIYTKIDGNTRILNTSLSAVLPPLLNPIIYTLKTEEVLEQIRKTFWRARHKPD